MIIWIASYPKSGNTWIRSFLSSYIYNQGKNFNFEDLLKIRSFPSDKEINFLKKKFGNYKFTHMAEYWDTFQKDIIKNKKNVFLKTHNAAIKIGNNIFANLDNCEGLIYVIRDPRNLVSSISNHFSLSLEESKEFILTPKLLVGNTNKQEALKKNNLTTLIGTWAEHYKFWKYNNKNYLLIKYEDIINDPFYELNKVIKFLEKFVSIENNDKKIENIINTTSFEFLKQLENKGNFKENVIDEFGIHKNFFYLGPENKWQNILDKKIIYEIENKLSKEMVELGYLK